MEDDKPPNLGGRPTKYDASFVRIAAAMAKVGATEFEIAKELQVDRVTLWRWKADYPEFCNAIKADKALADDRMEASLYHRGIGYSVETEKIFMADGKPVRVRTVEHYPPDTAAAFIWLKNRRPEVWRERKEDVNNLSKITDNELKSTARRLRDFAKDLEVLTDGDNPADE